MPAHEEQHERHTAESAANPVQAIPASEIAARMPPPDPPGSRSCLFVGKMSTNVTGTTSPSRAAATAPRISRMSLCTREPGQYPATAKLPHHGRALVAGAKLTDCHVGAAGHTGRVLDDVDIDRGSGRRCPRRAVATARRSNEPPRVHAKARPPRLTPRTLDESFSSSPSVIETDRPGSPPLQSRY